MILFNDLELFSQVFLYPFQISYCGSVRVKLKWKRQFVADFRIDLISIKKLVICLIVSNFNLFGEKLQLGVY